MQQAVLILLGELLLRRFLEPRMHRRVKFLLRYCRGAALFLAGTLATAATPLAPTNLCIDGNCQSVALTVPTGQAKLVADREDFEALGPFASWASAEAYGAVGDGIADDTASLQKALDDLVKPSGPSVLRLGIGTYRITRSLVITATSSTYGLSLIGEHPDHTRIVWDGPAGDPMLIVNGGLYSTFGRITWDGRSKAGYGVAHWWNKRNPKFGGSVEHVDEVFADVGIGIQGGRMGADYGTMDSEGQVRRVRFIRNSKAGLNVGSFNALNWWVWDSHFEDCARGVSNVFTIDDRGPALGAGNFLVYRSVFERSTVADADVANTGWFALHKSMSTGSRRFFQSARIGANGGRTILQDNRVIDTTDPVAIYNGNMGPLILIDNEIRSTSNTSVVKIDDGNLGGDVVSVGNRFTVANAISKQPDDRVRSIGDLTVSRGSVDVSIPTLQTPAPRYGRRVFELPVGASAARIQQAIDMAAAAAAQGVSNPVVHLPAGNYSIDRTLVVPASVRIQLAGDSIATFLVWSGLGSGPMIRLKGPSKATVRDLRLAGAAQDGLIVDKADQANGRILIVGSNMGPLSADGLTKTRLSLQANSAVRSINLARTASALSIGAGGIGPVRLTQESNLLLSDTWYEGKDSELFRIDSGTLTYRGGHIAPSDPAHGGGSIEPAVLLNKLNGRVSFIGMSMNLADAGNGIRIAGEISETKALFLGISGDKPGFLLRLSGGGSVGVLASQQYTTGIGASSLNSAGQTDDGFVLESLEQARSVNWATMPAAIPDDATDLKIYKVMTVDTRNGLIISGS